jgi:hypothetical protein
MHSAAASVSVTTFRMARTEMRERKLMHRPCRAETKLVAKRRAG